MEASHALTAAAPPKPLGSLLPPRRSTCHRGSHRRMRTRSSRAAVRAFAPGARSADPRSSPRPDPRMAPRGPPRCTSPCAVRPAGTPPRDGPAQGVWPTRRRRRPQVPDLHHGDARVPGHHPGPVGREGHPHDAALRLLRGERPPLPTPSGPPVFTSNTPPTPASGQRPATANAFAIRTERSVDPLLDVNRRYRPAGRQIQPGTGRHPTRRGHHHTTSGEQVNDLDRWHLGVQPRLDAATFRVISALCSRRAGGETRRTVGLGGA